jgi:single-stranded-DNA-specific exonuclease
MQRRWKLRPDTAERQDQLRRELGLSPLLARLLAARGIDDVARAEAFLSARLSEHVRSPMLFQQMPQAADRVVAAVQRGERVGIYGDYDVDGMSGSALLVRFLRDLGHDPTVYIPHRLRDGYGVSDAGVRELAGRGTRLMITVDCGAVSHDEIRLAGQLGMDTIVCDHHQVSGVPLPAHAVLNPIEADAGFPFRGLCGAGLAFYLALGVRQRLREDGATSLPDVRRYLELVALGTIADVVPLLEENRVLVKHGLRQLLRTTSPGLMALKSVSGVNDVSAGSVGFRLAPRLNACGRLDDASRAVELLTTSASDRARELATALDDDNRARQRIERDIQDEAVAAVERDPASETRRSIVLASPEWHPGVVGIVAARLVERYYRPTVLIALDAESGRGRGSGRSIAGFDIHGALQACAHLLEGFGGHKMAAGLTIREAEVPAFAEQFDAAVCTESRAEQFVPTRLVDAELHLEEVTDALMTDLGQLEPHGAGNPQPVFVARGVSVLSSRVVGESHLKLFLRQGKRSLPAIGFGMGHLEVNDEDHLDILYSPQHNDWNGRTSLQLRLIDVRSHAGERSSA